jgi:hypothetical protein
MNRAAALLIALALALALGTGSAAAAPTAETSASTASGVTTVHEYYGTVRNVTGTTLYLVLRTGRMLVVDASKAFADKRSVLLTPTRPVIVRGTLGANAIVHAIVILRSHSMPEYWPADS